MAAMLTTLDNPFNPFAQFDDWLRFDMEKGYNSCAYLDRIAQTTNDMSDEEESQAIEKAIDEIVRNDFLNLYAKVTENQEYNMNNGRSISPIEE